MASSRCLENFVHNRCDKGSKMPSTGGTKKYVLKRTDISKVFRCGHGWRRNQWVYLQLYQGGTVHSRFNIVNMYGQLEQNDPLGIVLSPGSCGVGGEATRGGERRSALEPEGLDSRTHLSVGVRWHSQSPLPKGCESSVAR